jgi:hypothetical protein
MRKYAPETLDEKKSLLTESRQARSASPGPDGSRGVSPLPRAEALLSATNGRLERASGAVLQMHQQLGNRHVQRVVRDARDLIAQRRSTSGERGQVQKNGAGLPDGLKAGIEHLSGESMSDVRVHYDSPRPAQIEALAYAEGSEIHVGPGQEQSLPHEAWHVVQQKQGRVKPTMEMNGYLVNDDVSLESEAHTMGDRASSMQPGLRLPGPGPRSSSSVSPAPGGTVQAARKPGRSVVQRLSVDRAAKNGMQVQLRTTSRGRGWKLSLVDQDGKGDVLSSILFVLVTNFAGKSPKLSIDTMQSRQKGGHGAGTVLMANIPWAVSQIVDANPLATRFGHVTLHSGFANVIAYQMTVKRYADTLQLRNTQSWNKHRLDALSECKALNLINESEDAPLSDGVEVELKVSKSEPQESEPQKSEPQKSATPDYNMAKLPDLWADTQVLSESGLFVIDGAFLRGLNVKQFVAKISKQSSSTLIRNFSASIDVKKLSDLKSQVDALQQEAEMKSAAKDE